MKKVIGIPGWSTGENSFGCTKTYLHWLSQFGDIRIIMPFEDFVDVDLLVLPGGPDLQPANYGQAPSWYTGSAEPFKEYFYREKLKLYVEKQTPIFGICLGFQMLNVFFGGSLEQHLLYHPSSKDRREAGHKIKFVGRKTAVEVNSHHHQGILKSQVSKDFEIIAVEDFKDTEAHLDLVVEAIWHKKLPIAGVQWHPEEWYDVYSENAIKGLLKLL